MKRAALAALVCLPAWLSSCAESAPPAKTAGGSKGAVERVDPAGLATWLGGAGERLLVDLRAPEAFAKGHVRGAVNLQAGYGQFELRAGRLFGAKDALCLMGDDPSEAKRLATSIAPRVATACWLDAKPEALQTASSWRTQRTITAKAAAKQLAAGEALVVDARTAEEYAAGHPRGAVFVYPDDFRRQIGFLRKDRPIVVVCEAGWRSSLLVSLLDREGFANASNLIGGMKAWRAEGLAVEKGSEQNAFR